MYIIERNDIVKRFRISPLWWPVLVLLSPVLAPFLLLYLDGLERAWRFVTRGKVSPFIVLAVIVVAMCAAEVILMQPVFLSEYNWFHLR